MTAISALGSTAKELDDSMSYIDSFSKKYRTLDEQIIACYEKIKNDSPAVRKRAVDEFKIFRSRQMDLLDEVDADSRLSSNAKVKELMKALRSKLKCLKGFIEEPDKKDDTISSLMRVAAAALGSAFGSALAGGIIKTVSISRQPPPEVTTLPPDTVFKTITTIHEGVDSLAPVSHTREIGFHPSLSAPVVWHSANQPIALGQQVPRTPLPVPMGFSSSSLSGPIPVAMGIRPPTTLAASTPAILPSVHPSAKSEEIAQASTAQELSTAERLQKLASDPNKKRVPSELTTLEQELHERGLKFADGTAEGDTQASVQTVSLRRWYFGPNDREWDKFNGSISVLIEDVDAKWTGLSGLTEQVDLARENLKKSNSPEEAFFCAEKLEIATKNYKQGVIEARSAALKLEMATNGDARREYRRADYFAKNGKLDMDLHNETVA